MPTTLVWNIAAYEQLMVGQSGPIARKFETLGQDIEREAKYAASGRPGPNVVTGRGRDSITHVLNREGQSLILDVGTNVDYMAILELYTFPNGGHYPWLIPGFERAWAKIS